MFTHKTNTCFGLFLKETLIGVTSGWTTTKLYSGKQLEIDNVVIDMKHRSKSYGKYFEEAICKWCKEKGYKFYFNQWYEIIGYHFEKEL